MVKILTFMFFLAVLAAQVGVPPEAHAREAEEAAILRKELEAMRADMSHMQELIIQMRGEIEDLRGKREFADSTHQAEFTPLPGMGKPAFEMPDISVIGNFMGNYGTDKTDPNRNKVYLDEMELALQGYLYPDIWANFIVSLHRESDGDYEADIEEGYVDFMVIPPLPGLSAQVGKKLIGFGKVNPVHAHHWNYADRPGVLESYLGDEGLAGHGVNFSYLIPLPFFAQADLGIWYASGEEHDRQDMLGLAKETYSTRLWSSFALTPSQELELGFSGVMGSGPFHEDERDRAYIGGMDLTYRLLGDKDNRLLYQAETLLLRRELANETFHRWGLYQFLNYRFNKNWDAGVRFDWFETPGPEKDEEYSFSGILTRRLTESSLLRLQYKYDPRDNDHTVLLQGVFGLGPHSHHLE